MSSSSSVMGGCKCLQWLDNTVRLCCIWFSCCLWTSFPSFFKSPKLEPLKEDTLASTYKSVSPQNGCERSWSHWAFFILYIDFLNCSNPNLADYCTALTVIEVWAWMMTKVLWIESLCKQARFYSWTVWVCSSAAASLSSDQCRCVGLLPSVIYGTLQKRLIGILSSFTVLTGCGRLTCMSSQYGDLLVFTY